MPGKVEEFLSLSTKPAPPCRKSGAEKAERLMRASTPSGSAAAVACGPRQPHLGLSPPAPRSVRLAACRTTQIGEGISSSTPRADGTRGRRVRDPELQQQPLQAGTNFGFVNDGFRDAGFRLLFLRRARLRRLDEPARVVLDRGVGRGRRRSSSMR